jgi:hypothetical protein
MSFLGIELNAACITGTAESGGDSLAGVVATVVLPESGFPLTTEVGPDGT